MGNETVRVWNNVGSTGTGEKALGEGRGRRGDSRDDEEWDGKEGCGDIHWMRGSWFVEVYVEWVCRVC